MHEKLAGCRTNAEKYASGNGKAHRRPVILHATVLSELVQQQNGGRQQSQRREQM
jgi:hypothetical protein